METYSHNRLTVELHNDEVETMREVVRLAHERLRNAPLVFSFAFTREVQK